MQERDGQKKGREEERKRGRDEEKEKRKEERKRKREREEGSLGGGGGGGRICLDKLLSKCWRLCKGRNDGATVGVTGRRGMRSVRQVSSTTAIFSTVSPSSKRV